MGSKLGDKVLLIAAEEGDELVAGALNLIGGDTLYGRLWGCLPDTHYPSLHFEACYYQVFYKILFLLLEIATRILLKIGLKSSQWGLFGKFHVFDIFFMFQAIEAAIELNLDKVEAGAQGEHKIQRGYLPVTTYSCHYILDEDFRNVIAEFLERETDQVT